MRDEEFEKTILEIHREIVSRNLLAKACGVDPVTFAWKVIEAWEGRPIKESSDDHNSDLAIH